MYLGNRGNIFITLIISFPTFASTLLISSTSGIGCPSPLALQCFSFFHLPTNRLLCTSSLPAFFVSGDFLAPMDFGVRDLRKFQSLYRGHMARSKPHEATLPKPRTLPAPGLTHLFQSIRKVSAVTAYAVPTQVVLPVRISCQFSSPKTRNQIALKYRNERWAFLGCNCCLCQHRHYILLCRIFVGFALIPGI